MKSSTAANRRRGPGRPWKKGQSGNPKGRPPISPDVRAAYRQASISAVEKLSELLNSTNEAVALQAAIEILNRAYGKPREIKHSITERSAAEAVERLNSEIRGYIQSMTGNKGNNKGNNAERRI